MDARFAVVGGGIVGLAVAARLSAVGSVILIERHPQLIYETSSRNSGVVHAGIYYPADSLKTRLCIEGNRNIWRMVDRGLPINAKRIGKWIGATSDEEARVLEGFAQNMDDRGIPWNWVPPGRVSSQEPYLKMQKVLESPMTGIVDVHSMADYFEQLIQESSHGSFVVRDADVVRVERNARDGNLTDITTADGSTVVCKTVITSVGNSSASFWSRVGSEGSQVPADEKVHHCKGRYVACRRKLLSRLVYPCPLPGLKGLGVHSIVDMAGQLRFGADATYVSNPADLSVDDSTADELIDSSLAAIKRYLPTIERDDLTVDYAGMRPKLSGEGEPFRDFVIRRAATDAVSELITLAGIESPGLTASTAIANKVMEMVQDGNPVVPAPWD